MEYKEASMQTLLKCEEARKRYQKKFGEDSLNRAWVFCSSLHTAFPTEEEALEYIQKLDDAILNNIPFKQLTQKEWDQIVF